MERERNYKSLSLFGKKTVNLRLSFNFTGLSEEVLPVQTVLRGLICSLMSNYI